MKRILLPLAMVAVSSGMPTSAAAANRTLSVGSFDRVRVEGPFDVRIATGSPGAVLVGDSRATEAIEIRVDGSTLWVRKGTGGWGEQARAAGPVVVMLSTPGLVAASAMAGARLAIARMRGMRIDLTVSGAGGVSLASVDTEQLNANVIGTGKMTIAGRAARARLTTSGPGAIDASALTTGDLTVLLDGVGETTAMARYTAQVTNTGLGTVTITGNAKCRVVAPAGGPVVCGR